MFIKVRNYFEEGHGKGPCNGIGNTSTLIAADAIKQRKFIIKDSWFLYLGKKNLLKDIPATTIDGTMKLHAVVGNGKDITILYQPCYCELCFENGEFNFSCSSWNFHQLNFPSHHEEIDDFLYLCNTWLIQSIRHLISLLVLVMSKKELPWQINLGNLPPEGSKRVFRISQVLNNIAIELSSEVM